MNGKVPFVLIGDFNRPPQDFYSWPGTYENPDPLKDVVVCTADNFGPTCFLRSESLIDFALIHPKVAPYVKEFTRDLTVPWSPHCGLRITLARDVKMVMVRQLKYPKDFPQGTGYESPERATQEWQSTAYDP